MSETDLDKYRRHVAHFDMPEAQKTELLRAVWRIMQSFVDRAFGDDPVQRCLAEKAGAIAKDENGDRDVIELMPVEVSDDDDRLSSNFKKQS